eukprot:m.125289 g.125289  ORF g.125289 m.125289 type:complete len:450 (+) comp22118_c0_seq5:282-1631(+)
MGDVAAARKICARIKRSRGAAISATFSEEALRDTPRGQARTDADLEEWVYQSWLDTDMSTTHPIPTLPSTGAAATTLDRAVVVQIDAVLDVSRAAYDQLAVIRGDRDKSNQWERSRHGGAEPASSKRVLKLKLTDGVSAVIGYEIQTVPWLRTHTMPGSKIKLLAGASIQSGGVLLTPSNCEDVKQWEATAAAASRQYESVLKQILGLADDDDDEGEDEDEMTTDGAPLAAGRAGHRATARGDDDDDDEMDDFLANMDMDALEEDLVAPPPSTHVDKRRRVEPRAAPKSVASAARAPVPAATAEPPRQGRGGHQHEQDTVVPLNEAASICASSPDTVALVEGQAERSTPLAKANGVWRIDVHLKGSGHTEQVYMGDSILTTTLGMSVDEFTRRKRAGKKDPDKKKELNEVRTLGMLWYSYGATVLCMADITRTISSSRGEYPRRCLRRH